MPLFDFHCPTCQTDFEELVSPDQTTAPECPRCHGTKSQKKLSVIAKLASAAAQAQPVCASGACDFGHNCSGGGCTH